MVTNDSGFSWTGDYVGYRTTRRAPPVSVSVPWVMFLLSANTNCNWYDFSPPAKLLSRSSPEKYLLDQISKVIPIYSDSHLHRVLIYCCIMSILKPIAPHSKILVIKKEINEWLKNKLLVFCKLVKINNMYS